MHHDDARRLLERIGVLKDPCDLDLLVFFARHPCSLLTSESLAAFLGYELTAIAASLEVLLTAGLLKRTLTPIHAARMYVLEADGSNGGWLPTLLRLASTRRGRLALREALPPRARPTEPQNARRGEGRPGPRAVRVAPRPNESKTE